jgi:hypothetical protein
MVAFTQATIDYHIAPNQSAEPRITAMDDYPRLETQQ